RFRERNEPAGARSRAGDRRDFDAPRYERPQRASRPGPSCAGKPYAQVGKAPTPVRPKEPQTGSPAHPTNSPAGSAAAFPVRERMQAAVRSPAPKVSRRTPSGQTRLVVSVGKGMGLAGEDIVGTILGHTGLPRQAVGVVDLRERHAFVDVNEEHANSIIA